MEGSHTVFHSLRNSSHLWLRIHFNSIFNHFKELPLSKAKQATEDWTFERRKERSDHSTLHIWAVHMLRPFFSEIPLLSLVRTFLIPIFNHLKVSFSKQYGLLKRRQTKKESGKGGERKRGREGGGQREREGKWGEGKKRPAVCSHMESGKNDPCRQPTAHFFQSPSWGKTERNRSKFTTPARVFDTFAVPRVSIFLSVSLSLSFFNLSICLPVYLHLSVLYICIALSFDSLNLCLPPN